MNNRGEAITIVVIVLGVAVLVAVGAGAFIWNEISQLAGR